MSVSGPYTKSHVIQGGYKKVACSFVIHTVHEQWSARRHGCVISDIKFISTVYQLISECYMY